MAISNWPVSKKWGNNRYSPYKATPLSTRCNDRREGANIINKAIWQLRHIGEHKELRRAFFNIWNLDV